MKNYVTKHNTDKVYLNLLTKAIEEEFEIDDMKKASRKMNYCYARHMFCYLARKRGYTYNFLGDYINRGHDTVIHSEREANSILMFDKAYKAKHDSVYDKVKDYFKVAVDFSEVLDLNVILDYYLPNADVETIENLRDALCSWSERIVDNLKDQVAK